MATLIDTERNDPVELPENSIMGTFDEEPAATETPAVEATSPAEEDTTPDKYKGKTSQELIAMHQEAERFNGKQSGEVGELRRAVDQLIQAQLAPAAPAAPVEEAVDFFDDPETAIDQRINNHPAVKAAEMEAIKYAKQTAEQALAAKHPDMNAIVGDSAFLEWVGASKVRTRLFQQAHRSFDYDAADELFSVWKERKGIAAQTLEVEKKERKQAVASASTGNAVASTAGQPRKLYRRADVIRLMNEDPARYAALSPEIMKAYEEGRVVS